jgi:hypothetical protein
MMENAEFSQEEAQQIIQRKAGQIANLVHTVDILTVKLDIATRTADSAAERVGMMEQETQESVNGFAAKLSERDQQIEQLKAELRQYRPDQEPADTTEQPVG